MQFKIFLKKYYCVDKLANLIKTQLKILKVIQNLKLVMN